MVPQAGMVTTDLGFPAEPSDFVYKFTGAWNTYQFDPDDLTFYPNEPTFGVGEGMMIKKAGCEHYLDPELHSAITLKTNIQTYRTKH